jgi:hypothetical protein
VTHHKTKVRRAAFDAAPCILINGGRPPNAYLRFLSADSVRFEVARYFNRTIVLTSHDR